MADCIATESLRRARPFWLVLLLALTVPACTTKRVVESAELRGPALGSGIYLRDELFFGRKIGDSGLVSDSAFSNFVEREVVPRFPEGFTLFDVTGYYRLLGDAAATREPTRILVVIYRESDTTKERALVDLIAIYKRMFKQESVLRVTQRIRAAF